LPAPAWHYPGGGWLPPAALCRAYLHAAADLCTWLGGHTVTRIERLDGGWSARDAAGTEIARAPVLVVALAGATWPLLQSLGMPAWPVEAVRGQISIVPTRRETPHTTLPLAGSGYALPEHAGEIVFGATAQRNDADPAVREADHIHNWSQFQRLVGSDTQPWPADAPWHGRVGWRQVSDDRLPVVGAVPCATPASQITTADHTAGAVNAAPATPSPGSAHRAPEHPRQVGREPGLFVISGLGSRGITWSALAAQVLAAQVSGQPVPLENSLVDAIDPARFACRPATRQG
jgi:tRNA 5-methylaminomethyl-2-thiouridine biosynthesis bifunctional protein